MYYLKYEIFPIKVLLLEIRRAKYAMVLIKNLLDKLYYTELTAFKLGSFRFN